MDLRYTLETPHLPWPVHHCAKFSKIYATMFNNERLHAYSGPCRATSAELIQLTHVSLTSYPGESAGRENGRFRVSDPGAGAGRE
jgi:hypothetical protein